MAKVHEIEQKLKRERRNIWSGYLTCIEISKLIWNGYKLVLQSDMGWIREYKKKGNMKPRWVSLIKAKK